MFMGEVVEIEIGTSKGDRLYRIRYTDGDLQHLTAEEVRKCQCSKPVASLSQAACPPAKRQKVVAGTSLEPAATLPSEVPSIQSRTREPPVDVPRTAAAVEGAQDAEEELGMQEVSMVDDMQEVSMVDDLQEVSMAEEPVAADESTLDEAAALDEGQEESLEGLTFVGMGEEGEEPICQQEEEQNELPDLGNPEQDAAAGAVQDLIVLEDGEDEEDDLDFDLADAGEYGLEQEVPFYGEEVADMAEEMEETPIPVTRSRSLTLQKNAVKTTGHAMMRPQAQAPVEYVVGDREDDDDEEEAT